MFYCLDQYIGYGPDLLLLNVLIYFCPQMILFPNLTYPMTLGMYSPDLGRYWGSVRQNIVKQHTDRQIVLLCPYNESTSHKLNRQTEKLFTTFTGEVK